MPAPVYVVGTRSFAAEVVGFARDVGLVVAGLLEPVDRARVGAQIHGLPVRALDDLPASDPRVVIGTGDSDRGETVDRLERAGWQIVGLVHPRAHVASSARLREGILVGPGVVVGAASVVGAHVVIGRGALIGHHTEIGDFSTIGPGANVAGNVRVGRGAFLGMGSVVRDHTTIGPAAVVAMGAVVVSDAPAGSQVRGLPAKQERE